MLQTINEKLSYFMMLAKGYFHKGCLMYPKKGMSIMRNRKKQRELKKRQRREERLDKKNEYGKLDPTPYSAIVLMKDTTNPHRLSCGTGNGTEFELNRK